MKKEAGDAPGLGGESAGDIAEGAINERLAQLACDATRLRLSPGPPPEVQEATAALQDLARQLGSDSSRLIAELREIQAALPAGIQSEPNGPYLVTNADNLVDWLGQPLPVLPQMALCRCGASQMKPFCDGSHAEIGFTDAKDPKRVPDRRDTYVGQQLTILDNRGVCQHSGYCSDRLATVFRVGKEPFVAPSGGRLTRSSAPCATAPRGALSYAIDGVEARKEVDHHDRQEPTIEGPYRITGGIPLSDGDGRAEHRTRAPPASTTRYAVAASRRTSRSAAACTGTSTSRIPSRTPTRSRRSSSGPAGCPR